MFLHNTYFIDLDIINQIIVKNIWNIARLLIMSYFVFYLLPSKIFPQDNIKKGIEKKIFNFVYMVAYVEIVITFLISIKVFSLFLFIIILFLTKLAFLKFYYKKDILKYLNNLRIKIMLYILNLLDNPIQTKNNILNFFHNYLLSLEESITGYILLKKILIISVFIFIILILSTKGICSYSNAMPDTSQFMEWVGFLQKNILYADHKTFGADFYGISIMIFFVNLFTNIDKIILFNIYPILLFIALYLSIFYIVKDFTKSTYIAIFAIIFHGMILMSPLSNIFLGKVVSTSSPILINWHHFNFYIPKISDVAKYGVLNGSDPYLRYVSGMAYEHSSVFVLLNIYFLIKILQTKENKFFVTYGLTLMLVFTFHGGGAIVLFILSILVVLNGLIFGKIDTKILKKGLGIIFTASIIGNMWMLSMIKYGIPEDFGAAAPFLDKIFKTTNNEKNLIHLGITTINISQITPIYIIFFIMLFIGFIFSFLTKRKFVNSSYILITIGIFFVYFMPNLGFPLLARQSRLADYMFFAITLLVSFYYWYFLYKPAFFIMKKYAKYIILFISYILFIILIMVAPKWSNSKLFWSNINGIEYTSIPSIILKIYKNNRPFSWTVISYTQEYAKVSNKGYHINSQTFILKYNPKAKNLRIPTNKIFIFIENFPNPYMGMKEWFYRWRGQIQSLLKNWIAIYSSTHNNIKLYYKTKTVTVYEIDNSKYVNMSKKQKGTK